MKIIVESYVGIWLVLLFTMLAIAFTSINLNVTQARTIYNTIRAEVQASNGAIVPASGSFSKTSVETKEVNGFEFNYGISRRSMIDSDRASDDETFRYNSVYDIRLEYDYVVPIFDTQKYIIEGYAY